MALKNDFILRETLTVLQTEEGDTPDGFMDSLRKAFKTYREVTFVDKEFGENLFNIQMLFDSKVLRSQGYGGYVDNLWAAGNKHAALLVQFTYR